jgi:hypothetical protein
MATKNDKVILNLKKEIETKKALLATSVKFNPITNCSLELDGTRYNLHVANKETLLLLIAKLNSFNKSLAEVMPGESLTISGYKVDHWMEDLIAKFNVLNVSNEKVRLQALEAKLYQLLSVDTKVEIEIEDLKKQI